MSIHLTRTFAIACSLALLAAGRAAAQAQVAEPAHPEIEAQYEIFTQAYQLDADMQQALLQELQTRAESSAGYEDEQMGELTALARQMEAVGAAPDSPEAQAVVNKLQYIADNRPLAPESIATWLDKRVPAAVAEEGRKRMRELVNRRDRQEAAWEQDKAVEAGVKKRLVTSRKQRQATVTPTGRAMPRGDKGRKLQQNIQDQKQQAVVRPAEPMPPRKTTKERRAQTRREMPQRVEPQKVTPRDAGKNKQPEPKPLPPAPPLDEWDRYVEQTAQKYEFSEAQMSRAQSILTDLRNRARQYRMSRADQFEMADRVEDAGKKKEMLDRLNKPLDAMFDELKQRLESLPTAQQRQRAEGRGGKR